MGHPAIRFYGSSDTGGAERLSSVSSGPAPASRTSAASISVTTATPGIGSSITSTTAVSTVGVFGDLTALTLFRTFFAPPLSLALGKPFLGAALATVRFAGLFRADLEGLRALRRVIDFAFRTAGRFFRLAIIAALLVKSMLRFSPGEYWPTPEESKPYLAGEHGLWSTVSLNREEGVANATLASFFNDTKAKAAHSPHAPPCVVECCP
jgi:hypothetical protein